MSRRALKKELSRLLVETPYEQLSAVLQGYSYTSLINPLFSFICAGEKALRWRAISSFGETLARMTEHDLESARIIMRRFLWSLNDESGGIGWGAPESMAEVMVQDATLRSEYLHMLLSYMREDGEELFQDGNQLELPMLQRGLLWGVARLAERFPDEIMEKNIVPDLLPYLQSPDVDVVCHSLRVLSFLHPVELPALTVSKQIPQFFEVYKDGLFVQVSTADLLKGLS